jgi:hypothetical protein
MSQSSTQGTQVGKSCIDLYGSACIENEGSMQMLKRFKINESK